jgi:hypothetical protein
MRKIVSIIRHLMCIARKFPRGQDCSWHWQHILREFRIGRYAVANEPQIRMSMDGPAADE